MINSKILVGHPARHRRQGFIPIRETDTGWLLFLYDPKRDIIEIQRRGRKQIIDLAQYKFDNPTGKENDDEQAKDRTG